MLDKRPGIPILYHLSRRRIHISALVRDRSSAAPRRRLRRRSSAPRDRFLSFRWNGSANPLTIFVKPFPFVQVHRSADLDPTCCSFLKSLHTVLLMLLSSEHITVSKTRAEQHHHHDNEHDRDSIEDRMFQDVRRLPNALFLNVLRGVRLIAPEDHRVICFPLARQAIAAGPDPTEIVRHTLRHTAITHLVQAGVDLPTVKRISGHKTLIMVERYAHQNGEHIQAAMDKLENRLKITE